MVEVRKYHLPPTPLIPNSPRPLLHYPGIFTTSATAAYDTFTSNKWRVQWIFRYGQTQRSHYHSSVHECMAVLSGTATIRFGVADTAADDDTASEEGGVELQAKAGDAFIVPAGVAHKTYNTKPEDAFALLTPGNGHRVDADDVRKTLEETQANITGFTMIGAYPLDGGEWDSQDGGEDVGCFDKIWNVPVPDHDPVLGDSEEGLRGHWT
ncbi:cupin domain-containing protein [Sarocladium implicatum]|nr:cupin domain-containing protein [Sarocladium implicatum]